MKTIKIVKKKLKQAKKKNKPVEEKNDKLQISNTQYKGGFITLKFRIQGNEENITIFNNDKINIANDNYNISYSNNNINNNKNLRYLDINDANNIEIKENILIIKKRNININQYEFVIILGKVGNMMQIKTL